MNERPTPSSDAALARMKRQGQRNTLPELVLRRALHGRGLRYRVHQRVLPGSRRNHDIVFTRARVVVEVRGCFWHGCPIHGTTPARNGEWWAEKLSANRNRDHDTERRLQAEGWRVIVVWEHEDPAVAAARVEVAVRHNTR